MRRTLIRLVACLCLASPAAGASEWIWLTENGGLRDARHALVKGDPAKAAMLAERVIERAGDGAVDGAPKGLLAQAKTLLCVCYRLSEEWQRAASACDRAIALAPGDWRGYVNRAALAIDLRQLSRARKDLAHANKRAPAGVSAIEANLALIVELQGR